jgi:tRNA A-37 threonylcarbamoyl transferase component Bud32
MPPLTGRLVAGRYRLIEPIGRGAMGIVWRASDQLLDRDVAVKEVRLNPALGDVERANAYKRTLREARTAARLSHRGVVTVFDVVEEDARPFIIMELIRSRSLDEMLATDGPVPARRAARIAQQLLSALSHAHAAGVLHRDVKPSNVLIAIGGYDERAVLTDFGIAQFEGDPRLTQTGMVMGSPGFTAPERIRGGTATPASDLWSLGATLFAACEGRGPYEARGGAITTMSAIINEDAPLARTAGRMGPIIAALLRRDPVRRPTASAAAAMITDILHSLPPDASVRTPTALAPTRRPAAPPPAPAVAPTGIDAPSPAGEKPAHVAGPARAPRTTPPTSAPAPAAQAATPQKPAEKAAGSPPVEKAAGSPPVEKAAAKTVAGKGRGAAEQGGDGPDTAPYDAAAEDGDGPDTAPYDSVPPDSVPPATVAPATVAEDDSGPDRAPHGDASGNSAPGKAAPDDAAPETAAPGTTEAEGDAESPAAPREAPANGRLAGDPAPDAHALAGAAAMEAHPADATPGGSAANGTTAGGSAAGGSTRDGGAASGGAASGSVPDGTAAKDDAADATAASEDGASEDGASDDGASDDGASDDGASDDGASDDTAGEAAEAAAPALAFATSMETAIRSKPSAPAVSQPPVSQAASQAPAAPLTAATTRAPRQAPPDKDAWWANAYQPPRPVAGPARNPPLPAQPGPQPYSQPGRYPQPTPSSQPASWPSGAGGISAGTIPQPSFPDDQAPLPSGGTPARRGRWKLLVALAVLVVVAAAGGVAAAVLPKHSRSGSNGAQAGTGTQSSPATVAGSVPPITSNTPPVVTHFDAPSTALPQGFKQVTFTAAQTGTKAGFTIDCPANWTVTQQQGAPQRIHFQDPNSSAHVDVDLTQHTKADMLAEAKYVKQKTLANNLFPGYKQFELDAQDLRGTRGGVWRFDYTASGGVTMRADDLLFVLQTPNGPQSYAIFGAAPEGPNSSTWNKVDLPIIESMLASFEPSPAS